MVNSRCKWIGLALLGLHAAGAWAQADASYYPYYLGASQTVTHDSYMARYGGVGQDWISTTGLRAGADRRFGAQQLLGNASVGRNVYKNNSLLDNTEYAVDGRLNWASVERLSGLLALQSGQSLYKNTLTAQALGRSLLRTDGATASAQLGVVTAWSFDTGLSTSRQRVSGGAATQLANLNTDQHMVSSGVRWAPTTDLSLRLGARRARGRLPSFGDDFTRNDVDLSGNVAFSGSSSFFARVSSTRLSHSVAGLTNLRGWTGLLGANWQPSGKLTLGVTASRDSNLGSVNQTGQLIGQSLNTNGALSSAVGLTASWAVTAALSLDSRIGYLQRTLQSSLSSTDGKDSITSLSMGLRHTPYRNLELGCGFTIDDHRVQQVNPAYAVGPYNARAFNCSGQAFLR